MASTIDAQTSQQYVDFDEYIEYQLQKTRGNIKTTDILTAFAFVAVFVLAYLLLFVIGDHWLVEDGFSQTTRIVLLSLVGVVSFAWIAWKVLYPYLRQVNALFAAKLIERSQPELRSTLLNLIDARNAGKELSPAILAAMEKRAALSMSQTNVDEAVDKRPLMWASYALLGLVVLFSLYTMMTPKKVSASIWRALFPVSTVEAPKQTIIEKVTPGDVEVIPGTRLEILADISGDVPEKVILHYSTADREFVDEPIEMREDPDMPKRYRARIIGTNGEGIQQSLNYAVHAGDDRSARYAVTVLQPPSAEIKELHYSYPAYMEREAKTRPTGNIDDYEGVIVTFLAESSMPLKSATITFHDDHGTNFRAEAVPMSPINAERTRFRANWVLSIRAKDGIYPRYYTVECKNDKGDSDPKPTRWPIRIHPDQRPEAKIINPKESQIERPANAVLPLTAFASDDFKVKSLTLWKQLNDKPPVKHGTLFEGSEVSLSVDTDWRLNENWPLKVGDKVSYWVQAEDNRTPEAGKRNSDKYVILIQPERPEEEVQKQLQSDRQDQKPKADQNDPSQKNPEEMPDKKQPRPEEGDRKNEAPQNEPMPQENPPKENQPQQNQPSENGGMGNESEQQSQNNDGNSGQKKTGDAGKSVPNDGSQDDKAIESLHRHFNNNQNDPGQENQKPGSENANQTPRESPDQKQNDPANTNPMENQTPDTKNENAEPNPMGNEPVKNQPNPTEEPNKQPGDMGKPQTGNDPSQNQEDTGTEPEQNPNKPPMPNGTENKPDPSAEKTPGPEKGMRKNETPKNPKQPADNQTGSKNSTKPDMTTPDMTTPDSQESKGGTGENMGEAKPTDSKQPANSKTESGTGGMDTEPGDNPMGRKAETPPNGTQKPAGPDKNAEKQPATGNETGPATSENDPNADPKPAKNDLKRTNPENPTATQKRETDPTETGPNKTPQKGTEEKPPKNTTTKPGSKNPGESDPENKTPKPSTNPEESPETMPDPNAEQDPDRKVTKPEEKPNAGDDELRGKGRPKGQEAKKPNGGESGSSKQNQTGQPGGTEQGPGDKTPSPGENDPAEKPNGGKPSKEPGEGSSTRPTDRTEEGPNGTGQPTETANPKEGPTADKPGESPAPASSPRNPAEPGAESRPGPAGPPDPGQSQPDNLPMTPEAAQAAEEANLEYGRQATDFALKKLENELKRGEVNEKWLKEMGWDKADAKQFLDRMKDRMAERDQDTPDAVAKQRQFNEWLKRLNKPSGETTRRTGTGIPSESARDLYNPQQSAPPAELRDLYNAYKRGISERTK